MAIPRSVRRWLRLPGQAALILGLGALSTAGARTDTAEGHERTSLGNVFVRSEDGKIYLAEAGKKFQELQLRDTAEARYLRQLIEQNSAAAGPAGVRLSPTILAGGGGSGFYWNPFAKTDTTDKAGAPDQAGTNEGATTPEKTGTPHNKTDPTSSGKKG
jgi:hypothetical protein